MNLCPKDVCVCVCVNVILAMSITLHVLVDIKGQLCCYHAKHLKQEHVFIFVTWTSDLWVLCTDFE